MKIFFKYPWVLRSAFILIITIISTSAFAETPLRETTKVEGIIIIINDLVIVNDDGMLVAHKTAPDSHLNVQAKISGNVRVRDDGYWMYKKGQALEFISAKMYLSIEKTVPVTIKVLMNELDEEETLALPVLIKAENDTVGKRFKMQVNGGMMAGIFLPLNNPTESSAKR